MRSAELVKLNSDTDYIPSKWEVVEVSVGGTAATTNLWLKRVAYGVNTEENLKKILNEYYYKLSDFYATFGDTAARSGIQREGLDNLSGPINAYMVTTLDNVSAYSRPSFDGVPQINIG